MAWPGAPELVAAGIAPDVEVVKEHTEWAPRSRFDRQRVVKRLGTYEILGTGWLLGDLPWILDYGHPKRELLPTIMLATVPPRRPDQQFGLYVGQVAAARSLDGHPGRYTDFKGGQFGGPEKQRDAIGAAVERLLGSANSHGTR